MIIDQFSPKNPGPGLYRYSDMNYGDYGDIEVKVELSKFPIVKETSCGVWILYPFSKLGRRWVSNRARKRFAYPTEMEALKNFKARKAKQIRILKFRLRYAQEALIEGEVLRRVNNYPL